MYYVYPAIFEPRQGGGYMVSVPDVPGCVADGDDLKHAMEMTKAALSDCLCVLEDEGEHPVEPTSPDKFQLSDGEFVALIEADTIKHRIASDNKSVRKNVSLPAWLNAKAEQANINCSQLLQKALKEELQIAN